MIHKRKIPQPWIFNFCTGAFKYYVIKEVGGWVGQMMMFDDKVGVAKWWRDQKIYKEKTLFPSAEKKILKKPVFYGVTFLWAFIFV